MYENMIAALIAYCQREGILYADSRVYAQLAELCEMEESEIEEMPIF